MHLGEKFDKCQMGLRSQKIPICPNYKVPSTTKRRNGAAFPKINNVHVGENSSGQSGLEGVNRKINSYTWVKPGH